MEIKYFSIFLIFFLISAILTYFIRLVALKFNIVDKPNKERKVHKEKTPLLGGIAIFITFFIGLFFFRQEITAGNLNAYHWLGVFLGAVVLVIGGILDDKYELKSGQQFIAPVIAVLFVIAGGVGVEKISNPFGGLMFLDSLKIPIIKMAGEMRYFVVVADLFTIIWLLGMMYTTKLLDGLDGLVTGISGIGGMIIFLFTMTTKYYQPDIGLVALVFSACCFGFLIWNWNPAKIFLGEGGSLLLGFILGILAIISGGKIAIALLILGIPILDVIWTIIRRLASGVSPFKGDRKHLHYRLLDLGLGQKKTVLIFYGFSLFFGLGALVLQSRGKLIALIGLTMIMVFFIVIFTFLDWRRRINSKHQ